MIAATFVFAVLANAADIVRVPPWELHSSFWMSLHQTLIADAAATTRSLAPLAPDDQSRWNQAVSAYRLAGGRGNLTFARPMVITTDALTQVDDDAPTLAGDAPLKDALNLAAPVYRRHWWAADDRANRFFLAYAAAMLREAGDELVRQHQTVYRTPWSERVRAYITPSAGPFGAYTIVGRAGGVITTMSCRDSGYQGLRALEMLLHESSHAIVAPNEGTVGEAIAAVSKRLGIAPPRDLWHAILFATSGELTRRVLVERGVENYVPSSVDLFTRAWPKYREPVEKYWFDYLNGQGTLEAALENVVKAIPR